MTIGRAGAAAGVVLLGLALLASAEDERRPGAGREHGRQGWQEHRATHLAEYLGLDAQQQAAVRQLHEQQRETMKPLREEGGALRRKLREATEAEKPDAQAVGEATLALKAHRERIKAERTAFEQKLVALLTPEQKQKLEALKAARELDRGPRGGRRPGRESAPKGDL
jgi:Spy/CpxP family protein refolding chaperone